MAPNYHMPSMSTYRRVVRAYQELGSVRKTASRCRVSEVTVRRVLITEGLWESPTSLQVKAYREQGLSTAQIADVMSVSNKAVEAYLPYTRGFYEREADESDPEDPGGEPCQDAAREEEAIRCSLTLMEPEEERDQMVAQKATPPLCRLRLELVKDPLVGTEADLGLTGEERESFFALAQARTGISREICVPADMNLHALHYAIQQLFGWQNSHLHSFSLSPQDFQSVTHDCVGEYTDLCGILFRFPTKDESDLRWDDQYEEGLGLHDWLKKRYRRPYRCGAVSDAWLGNQWRMDDFFEQTPDVVDADSLSYLQEKLNGGTDLHDLSERLCVGELFLNPQREAPAVSDWKEEIWEKLVSLTADLHQKGIQETDGRIAVSELKGWTKSLQTLNQYRDHNPLSYREEVRSTTGLDYECSLAEHQEMIRYWKRRCQEWIFDWNPTLSPRFHTLYYFYDEADHWCVKLTALEGEIYKSLHLWQDPVCTASDGLDLMEDCGGIPGFFHLLKTLHGTDETAAENARAWAEGQGWTEEVKNPADRL